MGRLGEWLGRLDERYVIYRAHDPDQKIHWRRLVVPSLIASGLFWGLAWLFGELTAAAVTAVIVIPGLILYVVWRRKRNERLTGSPTRWPDPE